MNKQGRQLRVPGRSAREFAADLKGHFDNGKAQNLAPPHRQTANLPKLHVMAEI